MGQTPIRIFIVSNEQGLTERLLNAIFSEEDLAIAGLAQDLENAIGLAQQAAPDIVLVGEPLEGAEDRLRRLAIQAPLAVVIAVCPREDPGCAQRALLAGARAFVLDPFSPDELCTVIREVHAIESERQARLGLGPISNEGAKSEEHSTYRERGRSSPIASRRSSVFALIGPKNGTGRSTIAVNLALLIRQQTKKEVLLMDVRHTLGDLDTMMNLIPTTTLADLGPDVFDMDEHLLRSVLLKHASGVWVLLSPQWLDGERLPSPDGVAHILELAGRLFDYVVIDCGPLSDPYTAVALQHADQLLLVVVPEVPALHRAALFLEAVHRSGFSPERIHVVLNRATARGGITPKHIQERLGVEVSFTIPEDIPLATYSINQGIPLAFSHPRSAIALSLARMAERLVSQNDFAPAATVQANAGGPRWSRLRGLLSGS
ncbi:MAG: hypothetical protein RML36_12795 [Anaerolineae bacterium]|nr:hypothetical protein [Anaerolineae bacterium]MDW8100350.1 hypothetical protein [Anaerolineae bacterium]